MGYVTGDNIYAPVSIADLRNFFSTTYKSLGDIIKYVIGVNANKWAKYKPVRSSTINTMTEWDATNNKWKATATWWKGSDGACGLAFSGYSSLGAPSTENTFLYKLRRNALLWTYNRVEGKGVPPRAIRHRSNPPSQ